MGLLIHEKCGCIKEFDDVVSSVDGDGDDDLKEILIGPFFFAILH